MIAWSARGISYLVEKCGIYLNAPSPSAKMERTNEDWYNYFMELKLNENTTKEIESGKYRDYYLIYNRKSTDDKENQQNSISYQKAENMRLVLRDKLRIAMVSLKGFCVDGMVTEKHSAFKTNDAISFTKDGQVRFAIERPKFQQVVYFLSKRFFKGVVFLSWDRASRNSRDEMIIRELMDVGIDFRFVNAKYDKSSAGELHKDIDAMVSKHRSRDTREKVTYTFRNLREKGVVTNRAPVGYLNQGDMYKKPFDTERAPIIKSMFELAATGEWTLSALTRWANDHGLTMPPMRRRRTEEEKAAEEDDEDKIKIEKICRPLDPGDTERILKNPFYYGMTRGNDGEWLRSISHEPLVSKELYDKAKQALRARRQSKHYNNKLPISYRGIFTCAECGRTYTPYNKKKHIYLGARCSESCTNTRKNVSASVLESKVGELINRLTFSNGELSDIEGKTQSDINNIENKRNIALEQSDRRKKKIREDLSYLRENRITLMKAGVFSPEAYVEEEHRFNAELLALQEEEQAADTSTHEIIIEVIKLSELLKNAYLHYYFGNSEEKERIMRTVFSELKFSGDTLQYQCKNGFRSLQCRFLQLGDPTESRTPLPSLRRMCPNR